MSRSEPVPPSQIPLLNQLPGMQRAAAEELLAGPLYRFRDSFQRAGSAKVFRVPTIRGLIGMNLAYFNPDMKAVIAGNRLIEAERRAKEKLPCR